MTVQDQLNGLERSVGQLLEGQRNASEGRRVIQDKQEKQDDLLDQLTARMRDIAVSTQMTSESVSKLFNHIENLETRLDKIEPAVHSNSEFRILAQPLVRMVRQIRLYVVALIAFFTMLLGGMGAAWAFAGDFIKAVVKVWLSSRGGP